MKFLTQEQFTEMCKLQDELNIATSGPDWKEKNQNWNLAIKAEVMEFFDYIGWKWWKEPDLKKKPTDMQARLELVDIWHFVLSEFLEISTHFQTRLNYETLAKLETVGELTREECLHSIQKIDSAESNKYKVLYLFEALNLCEWSWEELYKAYIGKVALNNFRQANGYKEGTYQKIWDHSIKTGEGLEDNYFLEQIMGDLTIEQRLTYANVYEKLENLYKHLTA